MLVQVAPEPYVRNATVEPVIISDSVNESEWDGYVATHRDGTVDHLWRWQGIFRDVFGHESRYLSAKRGNEVVGVLPLVLFDSRLFGRFIASVPFLKYGGLLASDAEATDGAAGHGEVQR